MATPDRQAVAKRHSERALEFATGYIIEKALSVDNLFVFVVLFTAFKVPQSSQHRVLFWGVLGALVMRAIFIGAGSVLLERFHWLMYLFGAFLLFTAYKLAREKGGEHESPLESRSDRVGSLRAVPPMRNRHWSPSETETTGASRSLSSRSWCRPIFAVAS